MLKAVLFDMDGVIVDTEPLHHKAYFAMFAEVNIEVSDALYESFTGRATMSICNQLRNDFNLFETSETLAAIKRKHFKHIFENDAELSLLDGVLDLIQDYHKNGLVLVVASSASMDNINQVFKRFNLDRYFTAKLSGADLKSSKPHPEIFIKAAQASGHDPKYCMVIEDSTNGITAAKAADIFCVAYYSPNSKNQVYTLADKVISHFSDIRFKEIEGLFL